MITRLGGADFPQRNLLFHNALGRRGGRSWKIARGRCPEVSTDAYVTEGSAPAGGGAIRGQSAPLAVAETARGVAAHGQIDVPKMIDALVERSTTREGG